VVTHAVGALRECAAAGINHHARTELQQVREVAAIQGQVIDHCALQRSAKLRVEGAIIDARHVMGITPLRFTR